MWVLKKPRLATAKNDIDVLIQNCRNLDAADKPNLEQLFDDYDRGGGEVTAAQLAATEAKKEIIKSQYSKTSGKDSNK